MEAPTTRFSYHHGVALLHEKLLHKAERILIFGPTGAGKSFLAAELARRLSAAGRECLCLSADPGTPSFGVPAAVNLGQWRLGHRRLENSHQDNWQLLEFEGLCSLDAARFRLPLSEAVGQLMRSAPEHTPCLIDAPGMTQGVAAAEMLQTLVARTAASRLVVLAEREQVAEVMPVISSLSCPVLWLSPSPQARLIQRSERLDWRTRLWQHYMAQSVELELPLHMLSILGTPPPQNDPERWPGLLVRLSDHKGQLTMGEVVALASQDIRLRCPVPHIAQQSLLQLRPPSQILLRDARHLPGHKLRTVRHTPHIQPVPSNRKPSLVYAHRTKVVDRSPPIKQRDMTAELVNGLFEDPLLLIKTHWSRRCILFDLGNTIRLPMRFSHHVSHIFITHAHFDHIGGFMGLLRVRLGTPSPCKLFGPPGLALHVAGMLSGILWDRIGENGPEFEVAELHGKTLRCYRLKAGYKQVDVLPEQTVHQGVIHQEARFLIRAVELDHGTPVLAYAYEPVESIRISEQVLQAMPYPPDRWLGKLKHCYLAGELDDLITLPNGEACTVSTLASQLIEKQAGKKLVYATDLADTPENRRKLIALARDADTLICEAAFSHQDLWRGRNNGHLTTTACGEIALAANVNQLVPFHFSRRYEGDPDAMYREIEAIFPHVVRAGPGLSG
ncbi:Clp1/GlmU family protein [Photobacterium atrarenae]|uniref:MBL fold metallo-hydrolase n=1 Tax=Photobacterium atrarenae TaxID=865757 RepID=A0ABY5GPJ3_9GAMM|nr:Clp1/GlmU family protein [Photobacterium atrarenae]UTV30579.1 MBL fold metallo-hydrolase [Photobacterium atrarenae]